MSILSGLGQSIFLSTSEILTVGASSHTFRSFMLPEAAHGQKARTRMT